MGRTGFVFALITIAAARFVGAGEASEHLTAARVLVAALRSDHNEYAYNGMYLRWEDETEGSAFEARCDCSGFITLLFEHVYGFTPERIKKWTGSRRPLAKNYHDQIEAGHGYREIKLVGEILPGDLIAIKYLDATKDTGHIMIVAEAPKPRETSPPLQAGTRQWEVVVIDSSKSGHGPDDTRRKPDKSFSTGVGCGTIRMYTDARGAVVGYTWSTFPTSELYLPERHHLVVGRLEKDFKP